jgi:hypothetical protein
MKNFILLFSLIGLFISCADNNHVCEVQTNGFIDGTGQTVMMGSEASIDVFKKIDAAWAERDYETLKAHIATGEFIHDDGTISTNGDEFATKIESSYQESLAKGEEWGWTTNFAFSVKPSASDDPDLTNTQGEWVNARFTEANGTVYEEWYQIADSKLISWSSAKRELPKS